MLLARCSAGLGGGVGRASFCEQITRSSSLLQKLPKAALSSQNLHYTIHCSWKAALYKATFHGLQVYTLFLGIYKTSIVVGFGGYILLILELFGVGMLLRPLLSPILSIQMLWYGLYFGVLGRDCAEVVSDTLVSKFS